MIELKDVRKVYGSGKDGQTVALDSVSLRIDKGELTAVVGPSGAGKSTLLHAMAGLCGIDSGGIFFEGKEVSCLSDSEKSRLRSEKFGIIMQSFALVEEYSVAENVILPLLFMKKRPGRRERNIRALAAMEKVGISHLKNKQACRLSGGEKQRTAIARCLCQAPSVILADEPTGQLDSANSRNIMEILSALGSEGMTVVIVTHDERLAERCSRIITMRDGKIESDRR